MQNSCLYFKLLFSEMKDPTYKSPLKSCAKEKDDTCPRPMDLPCDTKTGY